MEASSLPHFVMIEERQFCRGGSETRAGRDNMPLKRSRAAAERHTVDRRRTCAYSEH
jgi:hypothetical protein